MYMYTVYMYMYTVCLCNLHILFESLYYYTYMHSVSFTCV